MKIWLRILGGMYIVIGGLNALLFLFILLVYGGKGGIDGIGVEEFVPVLGHLGGWVVYVLLGFSLASMVAGVGLLKPAAGFGRLALFLFAGNLFVVPFGTFIALSTIGTLFFKRGRELLFAASSKPPNSDRSVNKDFAIFSRRGDSAGRSKFCIEAGHTYQPTNRPLRRTNPRGCPRQTPESASTAIATTHQLPTTESQQRRNKMSDQEKPVPEQKPGNQPNQPVQQKPVAPIAQPKSPQSEPEKHDQEKKQA